MYFGGELKGARVRTHLHSGSSPNGGTISAYEGNVDGKRRACFDAEGSSCGESDRLGDAGFDLVFPDHVIRFHALDTDLARFSAVRLADPDHLIAGPAVVALENDHLANFFDPLRRHQTNANQRNLIGAAGLKIGGPDIGKHFDRDRDVDPSLLPGIPGFFLRIGCLRLCCSWFGYQALVR